MGRFITGFFLLFAGCVGAARAQGFDLSGLPEYQPGKPVTGVIRISGNQVPLNLVRLWEAAFMQKHRAVRYKDYLLTTAVAVGGLCADTADIAILGHHAWPGDLKGFEDYFGYPPLAIKYATGCFDAGPRGVGSSPGVVIIVNRANPLAQLTRRQLDGIFGAQRSGSWNGAHWTTEHARGAEENIRTWGQVGLTGAWTDHAIQLYGLDPTLGSGTPLMQRVVFQGGYKWNPAIKEIVSDSAEDDVVKLVAADPWGMAYSFMKNVESNPNVKPLAIAMEEGGPYVQPSAASFQDQTYGLTNEMYIYVNRPPGQPLPPRIREFLRYILSREGQQIMSDEGTYLPLTAADLRKQLAKLD